MQFNLHYIYYCGKFGLVYIPREILIHNQMNAGSFLVYVAIHRTCMLLMTVETERGGSAVAAFVPQNFAVLQNTVEGILAQ